MILKAVETIMDYLRYNYDCLNQEIEKIRSENLKILQKSHRRYPLSYRLDHLWTLVENAPEQDCLSILWKTENM